MTLKDKSRVGSVFPLFSEEEREKRNSKFISNNDDATKVRGGFLHTVGKKREQQKQVAEAISTQPSTVACKNGSSVGI